MVRGLANLLGWTALTTWWQRRARRRARARDQVVIRRAPDRHAVVDNWTKPRV